MLPSLIGQYRILRKIGAGGMGLVYLGEHTLLRRRAAIKTLLPTVAANHEIVERFFNEARATSAIADPGVIQIFDFGYHVDGTAYIVMELLEGEALSARLDRLGVLPLGDALRFARQIAGSLAAAHARDIVHRDLKPENIFLVRDSEAQGGERTKIIDFGVCKMGAGDPMLTEVGAMIGTPVYMSPEQCRGSGDVDARSDIYSFGCLLFHLITGRPPFVGDASGELIVAHIQEPPPAASQYVPELPPEVDALLASCLAKEPDDRFASMTALYNALGELMVHAEAVAPAAAAPKRTVPLGRGFRSVFDANAAAALAGGSPLGWTPPGSPLSSEAPVTPSGLPPTHPLRARLLFAPPPKTPSLEIIDDDDDFDLDAPPPRRAIRAALACVLVVGVTLGLALTPLVLGEDDDRPPAPAMHTAALPVESPDVSSEEALHEPSVVTESGPPVPPPARDASKSAAAEPTAVAGEVHPSESSVAAEAPRPSEPAVADQAPQRSSASPVAAAPPQRSSASPVAAASKPPSPRAQASQSRIAKPASVSRTSRAPQSPSAAAVAASASPRLPPDLQLPVTSPSAASPAAPASPTVPAELQLPVASPAPAPPAAAPPPARAPSPPEDLYDSR